MASTAPPLFGQQPPLIKINPFGSPKHRGVGKLIVRSPFAARMTEQAQIRERRKFPVQINMRKRPFFVIQMPAVSN